MRNRVALVSCGRSHRRSPPIRQRVERTSRLSVSKATDTTSPAGFAEVPPVAVGLAHAVPIALVLWTAIGGVATLFL